MQTRIEQAEVGAQNKRIEAFRAERQISPDQLPKDTLYEEYAGITPVSEYGTLSLVSGFEPFVSDYREALEKGTLSDYLAVTVRGDYSQIYRAKGDPNKAPNETAKKIALQHKPEATGPILNKLIAFKNKVAGSSLPQAYKNEYLRVLNEGDIPFIDLIPHLGTPEFTRRYKTPQEWADFVDVEASLKAGTAVLLYEDIAKKTLEQARDRRLKKGEKPISVKQALAKWNLSPKEAEELGIKEIGDADLELSTEKGVRLVEILLRRFGQSNWKVETDDGITGITVQAKAEKVKFPTKRKLKGMDVVWIPGHELFHVVRAMNGKRQGLTLLREGVSDYLTTEEGGGAVAEMVLGQTFGDERQAKQAARYLAAAMMLKADKKDGQIVARFTPQQVYNQLVQYGVDKTDATDIVWRLQRGTTLLHKGLNIKLTTKQGEKEIAVAECYPKDTVYFEGQMEVFNWMKDVMPVSAKQQRGLILGNIDFSDRTAARIGFAAENMKKPVGKMKLSEWRRVYQNYVKGGRDNLIDTLNVLGRGKMRLDFLTKDQVAWKDLIANRNMVDYGRILKPITIE